jgi:hypothetical protein
MNRKFLPIVIFIFLCTPVSAEMAVTNKIIEDFDAKTGIVISSPANEENNIFIDLGTSQGIKVGDLFSVIGERSTIIHPTTGKEIVLEPSVSSVLAITRAADQYSYAKVILGSSPSAGESVSRFTGLSAYFVDSSEQGRAIFSQLRDKLQHIEWLGYLSGAQSKAPESFRGLVFTLAGAKLTVDYAPDWPVASYPVDGSRNEKRVPDNPATPYLGRGLPFLPYPDRVASLSLQPISGDILIRDKELLIASGSQDEIVISSSIGTVPQEIVRFPVPHRNKLLAVRWWQPDTSKQPILALTTWDGQDVEGMLLQLENNQVTELSVGLPYIYGTFDLNGDKIPESLFGQPFDRQDFYGQPIRKFSLKNDESLSQQEPTLPFPRSFRVLGSLVTDFTGDNEVEFIAINDQKLVIRSVADKIIHRSERNVGTGLSSLTYDLDPSQDFSPVIRVNIEPSPVLVTASGGQEQFLIFPRQEGIDSSYSPITSNSNTNSFGSLTFDGEHFIESTLPYRLQGLIASMAESLGKVWILLSLDNPDDTSNNGSGAELMSTEMNPGNRTGR